MVELLARLARAFEDALERASANVKLVESGLLGLEGSYVELLTILALGLLAVTPMVVPRARRQLFRRANQVLGVAVFIFVVFTCLGVFGMIRNFFRGLGEIGRENIVALYFCAVPATILVMSMLFGPTFCGWICPTGALQEFAGLITRKSHLAWKRAGRPFSSRLFAAWIAIAAVFIVWMLYLSFTRLFFVEDASIYWSEVLLVVMLLLVINAGFWDRRLRRLRMLSFAIVLLGAAASWRITSPVHFGFSKVYDPASILSTVMVALAALAMPMVWCKYLCPWREAIGWAAKRSVRRLVTDHDRCTRCGRCEEVCCVDAVEDGLIDVRECHMCLSCVDACPEGAIDLEEDWKCGS